MTWVPGSGEFMVGPAGQIGDLKGGLPFRSVLYIDGASDEMEIEVLVSLLCDVKTACSRRNPTFPQCLESCLYLL
jgi:hypothetical protein